MTTLATELPAAPSAAAEARAAAESAQREVRLKQLFRLWVRQGHLHPLIHLIRQFDSEQRR